jgi:hypothetical protein
MKESTIRIVLKNKVNEWLETIENKNLKEDIRNNCLITGGAIASMLLQEDVNDYDVYFTNKETTKKVAEYYLNKFVKDNPSTKCKTMSVVDENDIIKIKVQSQGVAVADAPKGYEYFETLPDGNTNVVEFVNELKIPSEKDNYDPVFISSNAITLSNDVQLILRFYGSPEEIHKNYDFVHCTNYWVCKTNELVLRKEALVSLLTKELVYVGSKYPIASLIRTRKFLKRGFNCNAGQYLKISYQISKLNLDDVKVLEDQLIGVDVAYFDELLYILKKEKRNMDYSYLANLIDLELEK